MSEAVTDCETKFLELLDSWCAIFPEGEHIDKELREVYFPRLLMQMSRKELTDAANIVTDIIEEFTKLVDIAMTGGMRESWSCSFHDLIEEFLFVGDTLWDAIKLRTH